MDKIDKDDDLFEDSDGKDESGSEDLFGDVDTNNDKSNLFFLISMLSSNTTLLHYRKRWNNKFRKYKSKCKELIPTFSQIRFLSLFNFQ